MWLFLYRLWRLVGGSFLGRNLGPKAGSTSQAGCSTSWAKELSEALKLRPICSALEQLSAQDWVQASATGGPVRSAQFQSWKNSRKVNKKSKNDNKVCEKRDFSRQNEIMCFSLWILNLKKKLCVFVWNSTTKAETTAALEKRNFQGKNTKNSKHFYETRGNNSVICMFWREIWYFLKGRRLNS